MFLFKGRKSTKHERQNSVIHFLLAAPFARRVYKGNFDLIHAHYADAAASFALLISRLTSVPFSYTTHAVDLFVQQEMMEEKIAGAEFIVTCTEYNKRYLLSRNQGIPSDKVYVIYHGLDVKQFTKSHDKPFRGDPPLLLSVGRLVKKKGIGFLIQACAILKKRGIEFSCVIVGDGPERQRWELDVQIARLNAEFKFVGAVPPGRIKEYYQRATIFVLPCIVDESGDQDGIPNVIAEAMSMQLPVVSSSISGIPELVLHGKTGFLLDQMNHEELANVLARLLAHPNECRRLGRNGRQRVQDVFDINDNAIKLAELLRKKIEMMRKKI